ncbi:hypothetical protein LZ198_06060 [Myxococcus sp. K15C18031901]|uniref:hypothetical protein n=1 Tax=Myxococcus dinghuensis TaxID=2906761 RepID=UPI0020A785AD|nr:hypothetical protein [Myxococcus dinghuensis]MCP3098440.1 hypothetical protein [Myxococcus dinghuensis]
MSNPDWLEHAVRRGQLEPWTLAHTFERYRQLEGLSEDALARELNCTRETLHWMSLCRKPEGEDFRAQVTAVAQRHDVSPLALAKVIRHVEIMNGFAESESARAANGDTAPLRLAARENVEDDEKNS